jgi:hypothetical protein
MWLGCVICSIWTGVGVPKFCLDGVAGILIFGAGKGSCVCTSFLGQFEMFVFV